jgi:hypothetical protein
VPTAAFAAPCFGSEAHLEPVRNLQLSFYYLDFGGACRASSCPRFFGSIEALLGLPHHVENGFRRPSRKGAPEKRVSVFPSALLEQIANATEVFFTPPRRVGGYVHRALLRGRHTSAFAGRPTVLLRSTSTASCEDAPAVG